MYIVKNTGTMVIGVAKDLELNDPTSPDGRLQLNTLKNGKSNDKPKSLFEIKPEDNMGSHDEEEKHLF
jgi:hypothetical protein